MQTIIQAVTVKQTKSGIEEVGIMVHNGQHSFFIRANNYKLDHKLIEEVVFSRGMYNELDDLLNYIQAEHEGLLVNGTWYDYDDFSYVFHKTLADVTSSVQDLWDDPDMNHVDEIDFDPHTVSQILRKMGLINTQERIIKENQKSYTADEIVKFYNTWYDELY